MTPKQLPLGALVVFSWVGWRAAAWPGVHVEGPLPFLEARRRYASLASHADVGELRLLPIGARP